MQADSTLPEAQRRHYKGVGDALTRIVKDEGAMGLFRGAGPTVTRAMALNMGMLASNDQVRNCSIPLRRFLMCTLQQCSRAALLSHLSISQDYCTKSGCKGSCVTNSLPHTSLEQLSSLHCGNNSTFSLAIQAKQDWQLYLLLHNQCVMYSHPICAAPVTGKRASGGGWLCQGWSGCGVGWCLDCWILCSSMQSAL